MRITIRQTKVFGDALHDLSEKYQALPDDIWDLGSIVQEHPYGIGEEKFDIISKEGGVITVQARLLCRSKEDGFICVLYHYYTRTGVIEFIDIVEN